VTLLEYGDYQCPYCGQAEVAIRELLDDFGDELHYVWRHLPLNDVHLNAQLAAEAAEAAAAQDAFWPMHDRLLAAQDELMPEDLRGHAEAIGLDVKRFWDELRRREYSERVAEDVASADSSGVAGTPSFFINGVRHQGAYDVETLSAAVRAAHEKVRLREKGRGGLVPPAYSTGRKPEQTTRIQPMRPSRGSRYACCSNTKRPSGLVTLQRYPTRSRSATASSSTASSASTWSESSSQLPKRMSTTASASAASQLRLGVRPLKSTSG
jgi:hypothetical protein